ncbi:MAG: tetratricopeptide repeat protein [Pseudomonadota bacterium]
MRNLLTWIGTIGFLGAVGYFAPTFAPTFLESTLFEQGNSEQAKAFNDCRSGETDRQIKGCGWLIDNQEGLSNEDLSMAFHNRGQGHSEKDNHEQAFADYDEAIRLQPDDYITYYVRGFLHQYREDYEAAVADYTLALELETEDPDVYRDRALALYYVGKYEESLPDLYAALKIDPDHAETLNSLAWTLLSLGRAEQALPISAKSLEEDGEKSANSLDTYAHIMAELGRKQEALEYFVKAARMGDTYYVRQIQHALSAKGFLSSPPDGVMTGRTREALKACIAQNCQLQLTAPDTDS